MRITRYVAGQTNVQELERQRSAAITPQQAAAGELAKFGAISESADAASRTLSFFNDLKVKRQAEEDKLTAMELQAEDNAAVDAIINDPNRKALYEENPEHFRRAGEEIFAQGDTGTDTRFNTEQARSRYERLRGINRLELASKLAEEEGKIAIELGGDRVVAAVGVAERSRNPQGMIDAVTLGDQFVNEQYAQATINRANKLQQTLDAEDIVGDLAQIYRAQGEEAGDKAFQDIQESVDPTSDVGALAIGMANSIKSNYAKTQQDDRRRAAFNIDANVVATRAGIRSKRISMTPDQVIADLRAGNLSAFPGDPQASVRAEKLISEITSGAEDDADYSDYWLRREHGLINDTKEDRELADRAIADRARDLGAESEDEYKVIAMQEIDKTKIVPQSWVEGMERMSSSQEAMFNWIDEVQALRDVPHFSVNEHMSSETEADVEFVLSAMDDDPTNVAGRQMAAELWWENKKNPDTAAIASWSGKDMPDSYSGPIGVEVMDKQFEVDFVSGELNPPGWDRFTADPDIEVWTDRTKLEANEQYMEAAGRIWRAGGTQAQARRAGQQSVNAHFGLIKVNGGWETMKNAPPSREGWQENNDWQDVMDDERESIVSGDFGAFDFRSVVAYVDDELKVVSPEAIDPDSITFHFPRDAKDAFSKGQYHMRVYVNGEPAHGIDDNQNQYPMYADISAADIEASKNTIEAKTKKAEDYQSRYEDAVRSQEMAELSNIPKMTADARRKADRARRDADFARTQQMVEEESTERLGF